MKRRMYRVKATLVERVVIESRVFAESGSEAERLVRTGKGERVSRKKYVIDRVSFAAKLDKGEEE